MSLKIETSKMTLRQFLEQHHTHLLVQNQLEIYTNKTISEQLKHDYQYFFRVVIMHYHANENTCWYSWPQTIYAVKEENPTHDAQIFEITYTYRSSRLRFYAIENNRFGETSKIKLTQHETILIIRKIGRHFKMKINPRSIYFTARTNGHAYHAGYIILPHNTSIYMAIHEIGHLIDQHQRYEMKHDKRFMRLLGKIHTYARKKNFWITTDLATTQERKTDLVII